MAQVIRWPASHLREPGMARPPRTKAAKAPASKSKSRQKQVASPISTGGRGVAFEHRVQAVRLLAMCLGDHCAGLREGFVIETLLFQGRTFGHNTDDLVIHAVSPGSGQKASIRMQMKRSPRAIASNEAFKESLGLAWLDFISPAFQRGVDDNLIAYHVASSSHMESAVEVVRLALGSLSHDTWYARVHAEGSNERNRAAYAAIRAAAEHYNEAPVADEDLRQFALHLKFFPHDLDSDRSHDVGLQKQLIQHTLPHKDSGAVWAKLVGVCAELNGSGAEVDLTSLHLHLEGLAQDFHRARLMREAIKDLSLGTVVSQERHTQLAPLAEYLAPLLSGSRPATSSFLADELPPANPTSDNTLASRQLDRISQLHNDHRYRDALAQLEVVEDGLDTFDAHQQARWYFLRGMCFWHLADDVKAAADLEMAASLYQDDERIAAGFVRAWMLKNDVQTAIQVGQDAIARFPDSYSVWVALTNARLLNREQLTAEEIPGAFCDKSGAWQMLASSMAGAGDDEGAVGAIRTAMEQSDSSIFILENYLRFVLRLATANPFHVNTRSQPQDRRVLILDAMSKFDDREGVLWAEQSPRTKTEIVFHLAYAHLLLGEPTEALSMIEAGRQRGVPEDKFTVRVELEALCDLQRHSDAVACCADRVEQLSDEARVVFGQACLIANNPEMLAAAYSAQLSQPDTDVSLRATRMLRHMHWELLLRENQHEAVRNELAHLGITPQNSSICDGVFAARAYAGNEEMRQAFGGRVAELAPQSTDLLDLSMASQWMLHVRRYGDAIAMLERLLPRDSFSPLHVDLLHCYALSGQRSKVRGLLESLPGEWRHSADARQVALSVYGEACDWPRMREMAELLVAESAGEAAGWLLLIQVLANESHGRMDEALARLPAQLNGSAQEQLKLANAELSRGLQERGLDRIYRAMRLNGEDVEAAAGHISLMFLVSKEIEGVHALPSAVEEGTSVELEDSTGRTGYVSIDFSSEPPLAPAGEFVAADSSRAARLLGLKVGDTTTVSSVVGEQTLTVKRIITLHRRLIDLSYERVSNSVVPSKTVVAMSIPTRDNGEIDTTFFVDQLEQKKSQSLNTISLYVQHHATIGLLARLLGTDVIELVRGWPDEGALLQVSTGLGPHDVFPTDTSHDQAWLIDLSMLVELATLGLLDVLELFPRLYVTAATKQLLDVKLEKSAHYRKSGTLFSHDGQLGMQELTEDAWRKDREYLESIETAIEAFCQVVPAYGPPEACEQLQMLEGILGDEDHAALLVCLEYGAGLLSIDARLRDLAGMLGIVGASPQMLLREAQRADGLSQEEYSRAVIRLVMARRSFVSVRAVDLIVMMSQGETFANFGINCLRSYLAEEHLAFDTAVPVLVDFVCGMYTQKRCNLGVMLQLIEFCFEPLFRHPQCPDGFCQLALEHVFLKFHRYRISPAARRAIEQSLQTAEQRAELPCKLVKLSAEVTYAFVVPFWSVAAPSMLTATQVETGSEVPALGSDGQQTEERGA